MTSHSLNRYKNTPQNEFQGPPLETHRRPAFPEPHSTNPPLSPVDYLKNYADLLTKPLSLDPFRRFRDAILGAQIILPSQSSVQSSGYVARLSAYIVHAMSLPDTATSCLCTSGANHCLGDNADYCSSYCYICSDGDDALSPPFSAGGGVKPSVSECCNGDVGPSFRGHRSLT